MPDRRFQPRLTDAELVMISFEENGTKLQQLDNLENMSLNGAGIIVGHPIPAGSAVTITYGEGELTGIVRHCTALTEEHLIGVEFVGNSKASLLHFQPELLIWTK
jgi:hypothetical protein